MNLFSYLLRFERRWHRFQTGLKLLIEVQVGGSPRLPRNRSNLRCRETPFLTQIDADRKD